MFHQFQCYRDRIRFELATDGLLIMHQCDGLHLSNQNKSNHDRKHAKRATPMAAAAVKPAAPDPESDPAVQLIEPALYES